MKEKGTVLNYRVIISVLLIIAVVLSAVSVALFVLSNKESNPASASGSDTSSTVSSEPVPVEKQPLTAFKSVSVVPGKDLMTDSETETDAKQQADKIIETVKADGFDTIELTLNYKNGLIFPTDNYKDPSGNLLEYFYTTAQRNGLKIVTAINIASLFRADTAFDKNVETICSVLSSETLAKNSDMLVLKNCYVTPENISENKFNASNSGVTYAEYIRLTFDEAVKKFYFAAAKAKPTMALGVEINETDKPESAVQNVGGWLKNGSVDFAVLYNPYSTESDEQSFMTYYESVRTEIGAEYSDLFCKLAYNKVGSNNEGWKQTDQIFQQLKVLDTLGVNGFVLDGYSDFVNDKTESREFIKKYFANLINESYVVRELSVTSPAKQTFTTTESTVLFAGASDPQFRITLNGEELERSELGFFSTDIELKDGLNTIIIEHNGVVETYKITYKRTIIVSISPASKTTLPSQSILLVSCIAISGSKVTATLGETSVTLKEEPILDQNGNPTGDYSSFSGRIELPVVYDEDISLGKISFTAESKYGTETKTGGNINILKEERPVPPSSSESTSSGSTSSGGSAGAPTGGDAWVMPSGGKYVNVGTTYIAEVVNWQAETFSSTDDSDYSRPTNNYLPAGTVDYCSSGQIWSSGGNMRTLRYGNMLYTTSSKGIKTIKVSQGTLPDHNTVGVAGVSNTGRHTQITLDVLWKAPFRFELAPQKYTNEGSGSNRDYTITSATFDHIDITFCYTTLVAGEVVIPESDPVFSKAEWIKNQSDYTLRLYLKKTGMFYGWSAEYNDAGQLVFSFLNPAKISTDSTNSYGYRLDGVIIAIDVGHGGNDVGAVGSNKNYSESVLNLILAEKLKAELEALGAKVYMTRYDNNTNPSSDERMKLLRDVKADYCIAIHRNAVDSSKPQGFISYHFNAFSANAAKLVYKATEAAQLYKKDKWYGTKWHYFYTARQTDCPVVLTENGFITNAAEFSDMIRDDFNNECAKALTQGIVDYFVSIQ